MADPRTSKDESEHVTDEKFNAASHLAASIFSLMGSTILVVYAAMDAKVWHIVSFAVYGTTLTVLFAASALHHGVNASERIERLLRWFDYIAIYLLIAGTMTPISLVMARGPLGWSLFGVAWLVAGVGIALRTLFPDLPKWVSLTLYATMGWLGAFIAYPVYQIVSWQGAGLVLGGGVLYTLGSVLFITEKPNPIPGKFGFHEIWHLFVISGAAVHYAFMWIYVLPYSR